MANNPIHFLLICETCKGTDAANAIRKALTNRLPSGFTMRMVSCMAGCDRPTTVGFQAAGKAQYLFGDISSSQDVDALAQFARQFHDSSDGWTNATDRPRALFEKTLARLPRLTVEEHP
jgi:predicted metal-binding protein